MNPNALRAFLALALAGPVLAGPVLAGQIDVPVAGEFSPGARTGSIGTSLNAPIPLQMNVPALSGALSAGSALTVTPSPILREKVLALTAAPVPVIAAAVPFSGAVTPAPGTARALKTPALTASLQSVPSTGEKNLESGYDEGRARFDLSAALDGDAPAPAAGGTWSKVKSALLLKPLEGADRADAPPVARGFKERLSDTAELGLIAGAWQVLAAVLFAIAGAHAAFPVLAGALWALGGAELIKHLGSLRSVVVGGWQSSHDQKMRTDHATGKLKDIRGRKYGEDRYDITLPGPVTPLERNVVDAAAVLSGLPWVVTAGPSAVAFYLISAATVIYLRRLWQRSRPQPKTATAKDAVFERDR